MFMPYPDVDCDGRVRFVIESVSAEHPGYCSVGGRTAKPGHENDPPRFFHAETGVEIVGAKVWHPRAS